MFIAYKYCSNIVKIRLQLDSFTLYIIITHAIISLLSTLFILTTDDIGKVIIYIVLSIIVLMTHLKYGSCLLTELEMCFQKTYTTSDVQLSLLNLEKTISNRRLITTINVLLLTFVSLIKFLYLL